MLDKAGSKILKVLNSFCSDSSYAVVELEEIAKKVSKKTEYVETLKKYLEYLNQKQFIDIKYQDDNELCFCITPKTRVYDEELAIQAKLNRKYFRLTIIVSLFSALSAFIGAFLAFWLIDSNFFY